MKRKRSWLFLMTLLSVFIPTNGQAKELSVVTSIRPIHSLVSAIMGDVANPYLIVSGGESPHTYAMKTSDARQLENADIVFWVGEGFETFLEKAVLTLSTKAEIVTLLQIPNMLRLPVRDGGVWETHTHGDEEEDNHAAHRESVEHGEDIHDDHNQVDMHVWLDPQNAIAIAEEITMALTKVDGDHAETYRGNALRLVNRLKELQQRISTQLNGLEERAFIQFHDAFQYLENRFSLNAAGAITLNPERQVGAGRVKTIRNRIIESNVVCIFTEPQFEPKLVEIITEGLEIKVSTLDPMGIDISPGPELYFLLMTRNSDALESCLTD